MEAKELGDERVRVLLYVVVIVFEYFAQMLVLPVVNSFEHILTIRSVVEKGSALALAGQSRQRGYFSHHEGSHEFIWSNAVNILLVVDVEHSSDVVEGVGGVVSEATYPGQEILVSKSSGHQLEIILQVEVLGLFVDHFLISSHTPHCHLYTNHHIQHQVPVIVPEEYHCSLSWSLHVDVVNRLIFFHCRLRV